ncbi:rhodanese-like domain-containing protein [Anaeromyxobacter sp. Red801]|uniref:rhodanese-like domain-containing protein n=1 Tax=Anaeromyxobacter sp. Red801 TaxID=3411632 RepID=UPI003B9E4CBE
MIRISTEEAAQLIAQGGYDLVDVREPHEWAGGHIPGARHVPLGALARAPADHLTRDRVIFVCGHGMRSQTACAIARSAGLSQVFSVDGGVVGWAAEGRPLSP